MSAPNLDPFEARLAGQTSPHAATRVAKRDPRCGESRQARRQRISRSHPPSRRSYGGTGRRIGFHPDDPHPGPLPLPWAREIAPPRQEWKPCPGRAIQPLCPPLLRPLAVAGGVGWPCGGLARAAGIQHNNSRPDPSHRESFPGFCGATAIRLPRPKPTAKGVDRPPGNDRTQPPPPTGHQTPLGTQGILWQSLSRNDSVARGSLASHPGPLPRERVSLFDRFGSDHRAVMLMPRWEWGSQSLAERSKATKAVD